MLVGVLFIYLVKLRLLPEWNLIVLELESMLVAYFR